MEVLYLISVISLLITFILVRKTKKEIDIISFICISVIGLFCYNTFIAYILTFFKIPITLGLLAIINLLFTILFLFLMIKNKERQKYIFKKVDIIYIAIIALVVLVIAYINFGIPFNINYETGDSTIHYLSSVMFAKSESLLAAGEVEDQVYGTLGALKPMSYTNSGIVMKCLCSDFNPNDCYNIFVCFGLSILFLIGVSIYSTMKQFAKKDEHIFWAFIVALICMLGYPLNSLIFGFEYLTMGLLVLCAIIDFANYYEKELLDLKWFIPIMALLNFGLFCSYYMFVPFVYPALWIYFYIKNYQKTKKVITKKLVIILLVTLLIPFILGYIYSIAPNIYKMFYREVDLDSVGENSKFLMNSGFKLNGYIYINLYSNMLLLMPLTIYLFIKSIKDKIIKKDVFIFLLLFFILAFIGILLIGNSLEKVSMYYLSKNYFALWIILLYCNYRALVLLSNKGNYLSRLFISTYVFLMIVCTVFSKVQVKYYYYNPDENVLAVMNIFEANKDLLLNKPKEFNQEELEILNYARENLDYNKEIEVIADENAYYWQYVLLGYINTEEEYKGKISGQNELILKMKLLKEKINKVDYIIYFNKSERYNQFKDKLFENSKIIYKNSAGGIIKYLN